MLRTLVTTLLLCMPPAAASPRKAPALVLDSATAAYLEDAPGARPVARIVAELIATPTDTRLRLRVGACGDQVVPVPGFDGVHGANLRTAEELDRLLRDDRLQLIVRVAGISHPGELLEVQRAPLPARRLRPDGALVTGATTPGSWPVLVTFGSPPLPDGTTWCHLLADGVPRLAVQVRVGEGARIVAIESLAETGGAPGGGPR